MNRTTTRPAGPKVRGRARTRAERKKAGSASGGKVEALSDRTNADASHAKKKRNRGPLGRKPEDEPISRQPGRKDKPLWVEKPPGRSPVRTDRRSDGEPPASRIEKKQDPPPAGKRKLQKPKAHAAEPKKPRTQSRAQAKLGKTAAGSAGAALPKSFQGLMCFEIKIFIADFALKEAGFFPRVR